MGKSSNKHLIGQPILQQILDLVPREVFDKLVLEHEKTNIILVSVFR